MTQSTADVWLLEGFNDPVHGAQETSRAVLHAMSAPGQVVALPSPNERPDGISDAATVFLLTLADYTTPIWLDPALARKDNLIALNASAAEAYGGAMFSNDGDNASQSSASFLARFVEPSHGTELIEACRNGEEPSRDCLIKTATGNHWHKLRLRLARDPLTGSSIMIAVEDNITELKEAVISLKVMSETLEERVEERTAELRQKEEILRESERNYRAVVEDQSEMICRHTPDGKRTFVNEAYCRFQNKSKEQLIGRSAYEGMPTEELERLKELYQTLTPENPHSYFEASTLGPDGNLKWQRWSKRVIFDSDLKLVEYQAVGRDITEQKRAEEQKRHAVQEAYRASAAK